MTTSLTPTLVRVRTGVLDATLGDVGGAVGVVRRTFEVAGVEYVDIELSAETLEQMAPERRSSYYEQKIVFTRLRLPTTSVEPSGASGEADLQLFFRRRAEMQRAICREWYERVGDHERDPTAEAVDLAARVSRRRAMLIAAGVGAVALGAAAYAIDSCEAEGRHPGSWWRSSGSYGGYYHGGVGS